MVVVRLCLMLVMLVKLRDGAIVNGWGWSECLRRGSLFVLCVAWAGAERSVGVKFIIIGRENP